MAIDWKIELPETEGKFLIAVHQQRTFGIQLFNDLAYFQNGTWFKYDPFTDEIGEIITDAIVGYAPQDSYGGYKGQRIN